MNNTPSIRPGIFIVLFLFIIISNMADTISNPDVKTAAPEVSPNMADFSVGDVEKSNVGRRELDPAMAATGGAIVHYSDEAYARVLRKIDTHMLPLMCWIYLVQFADKSSLNYSSLMGIKTDNHLDGYQYSWLGSIFYAGYIFWEYVLFPQPCLHMLLFFFLTMTGFLPRSSSGACPLESTCPSISSSGVPSCAAMPPPQTGPA